MHSCTRADMESVSDFAVPSRFELEYPDLQVLQDEQAPVPQHHPTFADPSASVTLKRLRHSLQLSSRAPSTSL